MNGELNHSFAGGKRMLTQEVTFPGSHRGEGSGGVCPPPPADFRAPGSHYRAVSQWSFTWPPRQQQGAPLWHPWYAAPVCLPQAPPRFSAFPLLPRPRTALQRQRWGSQVCPARLSTPISLRTESLALPTRPPPLSMPQPVSLSQGLARLSRTGRMPSDPGTHCE